MPNQLVTEYEETSGSEEQDKGNWNIVYGYSLTTGQNRRATIMEKDNVKRPHSFVSAKPQAESEPLTDVTTSRRLKFVAKP